MTYIFRNRIFNQNENFNLNYTCRYTTCCWSSSTHSWSAVDDKCRWSTTSSRPIRTRDEANCWSFAFAVDGRLTKALDAEVSATNLPGPHTNPGDVGKAESGGWNKCCHPDITIAIHFNLVPNGYFMTAFSLSPPNSVLPTWPAVIYIHWITKYYCTEGSHVSKQITFMFRFLC